MPTLHQQADDCLHLGDYTTAIALYQQCIDQEPSVLMHYWQLGLAWLLAGDADEAQGIWMMALATVAEQEAEAGLGDLHRLLTQTGDRLLAQRQFHGAEEVYLQALELLESAEIHEQMGLAIAQQGRYDDAIVHWQQATFLQPDRLSAYRRQGQVWQKLGQWSEAIAVYEALLTHYSQEATIYHALGQCWLQLDQLDVALTYLQQSVQQDPSCAPAWGDIGMLRLLQGNFTQAIAAWQTMVTHCLDYIQNYVTWVHAESESSRNSSVILNAHFWEALIQSNFNDLCKILGDMLQRAGKVPEAIACYQNAQQSYPQNLELWLDLGRSWAALGQWQEAIAALFQGLRGISDPSLCPELWIAMQIELSKAWGKIGNIPDAVAAVQSALAMDSRQLEGLLHLGNLWVIQSDWEQAIAQYTQAIKLDDRCISAHFGLGVAHLQTRQISEAVRYFRQVIRLNSDWTGAIAQTIERFTSVQGLNFEPFAREDFIFEVPPQGFYPTAQSWIDNVKPLQKVGINVHPIGSEQWVNLTPPRSLDDEIHFSFRFGEAIALPSCFVAEIPQGYVWWNADQTSTAVLTADRQLLADLSPEFPILSPGHPDMNPAHHQILRQPCLPPVEHIGGTVAVLSGLLNDVYFHWMLDVLPRWELLRRSRFNLDAIDVVLVNTQTAFQRETLDWLEIPEKKRLDMTQYPYWQADRLIVPSFPGSVAWMHPWTCDVLKRDALRQAIDAHSNHSTPTRLYLSRAQTSNRRLINESAVVELLNAYGFESVTLEGLSVQAQAQMLAKAEAIVAPHGSGLTNLAFCQPGTIVIELFSPNYVYSCYWFLSNLIHLNYYYLVGEQAEGLALHPLLYPSERIEDMWVNVDDLHALLQHANLT